MHSKEFIKQAENYIYKAIAKNLNLVLGKNKTNHLSTGVFLKLPIEVQVEQVDNPLPKLNKELHTFFNYFSGYVMEGDQVTVHFTFLYNTEKDLHKLITDLKYRDIFFTFVYLHELQHIIRKHNTTTYNRLMTNIAKDIFEPHQLINIAEDYAINYSIKDLFMAKGHEESAKDGIKDAWQEIENCVMYRSNYHEQKMSDIEILKDLIEKGNHPTKQEISDLLEKISFGGKESIQPKEQKPGEDNHGNKKDKTSTDSDDKDISLSDLSESLKGILENATKGTATGELINQLFESVKVETGWFKKIKASFKRQVYYKTHDYTTSWANLNNTFRRIYKSPKKEFIDNKINMILSIDHSGSMNTLDLQKLLYLIESEGKKISEITVLIHDTNIKKVFKLESEFDITKEPEFKDALSTRYTVGGTSHDSVFSHIQEMNIKEPAMIIYMSFSDNMSDIEQTISKYPIMRNITNYWICAGSKRPVNVQGTNIFMS